MAKHKKKPRGKPSAPRGFYDDIWKTKEVREALDKVAQRLAEQIDRDIMELYFKEHKLPR
jgi:hypothetical protein